MGDGRERLIPQEGSGGLNLDRIRTSILRDRTTGLPPVEIPWKEMGLATPEQLLGTGRGSPGDRSTHLVAFRDDGDKEKFTVPKRLEKSFKDLTSENYETRQKALKDLREKASLRELVDLRNKVPGLDLEQARRLDPLIAAGARQAWSRCSGDPRKFPPDLNDPKVVDVLLKHAPKELREARETDGEVIDFIRERPHKAKEYNKVLGKLERVAAFSEWVDKAAAKEGASQETKDFATDLKKGKVWRNAKALMGEIHHRLADPEVEWFSDAKEIPQKEREAHGKAARQNYLDMVASKDYSFDSGLFHRQTKRFLNDKTVPDKIYNDTIRRLTDKALESRFDRLLPNNDRDYLMIQLGLASENAPPARAKELSKHYDRLSADLEKRVAAVKDPEKRLSCEISLIAAYYHSGRPNKAKAMYAKALKSNQSLPEDERNSYLTADLEMWKKHLKIK